MSRLLALLNPASLILFSSLTLLCSVAAASANNFNNGEKAAIRQVIKNYIKENPEILRDALIGLAAHEEKVKIQAGIKKAQLDDGDPIMGNKNGSIVIYEFTDYNCGYCKRMFAPIQKMLANNDDIRMVIKEFPILSQSSLTAAQAGIAAQKQGKFPKFHKEMMTYRGQVSDASIMAAANKSGLNIDQLQQDMDSLATAAIIKRTRAGAAALDLNGTPAFIIGENVIPGAVSIDELQSAIDRERLKQN
ncbi:DsbA family protein [Candidatus Puniceispirillum sp.]|nr:DsbA family protein [Candidatus Puniceispirillum sp.]